MLGAGRFLQSPSTSLDPSYFLLWLYHSEHVSVPTHKLQPVTSAGNHDWLKMIVSASIGFIAAICLEPIQNKIQRRHSAKLAKRMIKRDLVRLLERAYHYERQDMESDNFWRSADIPAYSHFRSASPNLFYEEKDMHLFGGKCERLLNAVRTGQTEPFSADLNLFRRNLEAVIDDGRLLAEAKRVSGEN